MYDNPLQNIRLSFPSLTSSKLEKKFLKISVFQQKGIPKFLIGLPHLLIDADSG